jgi:hypothetical protein
LISRSLFNNMADIDEIHKYMNSVYPKGNCTVEYVMPDSDYNELYINTRVISSGHYSGFGTSTISYSKLRGDIHNSVALDHEILTPEYIYYKCACHKNCSEYYSCKTLCPVKCEETPFCHNVLPNLINICGPIRIREGDYSTGSVTITEQEVYNKYKAIPPRFRYRNKYITDNLSIDFGKYFNDNIIKSIPSSSDFMMICAVKNKIIISNYTNERYNGYKYYDGIVKDILAWKPNQFKKITIMAEYSDDSEILEQFAKLHSFYLDVKKDFANCSIKITSEQDDNEEIPVSL